MWKVTRDHTEKKNVNICSCDYKDGSVLPHKFRMLDDDGEVYYTGYTDDNQTEEAFAPLDDYGTPNAGCTSIEYYDPIKKEWEMI